MAIEVISQSQASPISLSLLKKQLRIIESDEDDVLEKLYIPRAVGTFEHITGRSLINKTYRQTFDQFPCENFFLIERSPLVSVAHVKYYDRDNQLVTLDPGRYIVAKSSFPPAISHVGGWPSDIHPTRMGAVEVTYTAGYGVSDAYIPTEFLEILALIVGDLLLHKEDSIAVPGIVVVNPSWHSYRLMKMHRMSAYSHKSQSRK